MYKMFQKKKWYQLRSTGCFRKRNDIIWDQQAAPEKEMISFEITRCFRKRNDIIWDQPDVSEKEMISLEINRMFQKKKWYHLRSTRCFRKRNDIIWVNKMFQKKNDIWDQPDVSEKEMISFEINKLLQKKKWYHLRSTGCFRKRNDIIWDNQMFQKKKWYHLRSTRCFRKNII